LTAVARLRRAKSWPGRACALLALCAALSASAVAAPDPGRPTAPKTDFVPTAAGTYTLQRIQASSDGVLLDALARSRSLSAFTHGKITLLTFFYTYCTDPLGCPFAFELMTGLRERIVADAALRSSVRFVSISFDPTHDSPAQLRSYAGSRLHDAQFEWEFLTAPSMAQLQPVLDGFGQDVRVEVDRDGRPVRAINHMLKLFLIDESGVVREIYALDFLQPEVLLNDIRTLSLESQRRAWSN
jgi:protein SCO1